MPPLLPPSLPRGASCARCSCRWWRRGEVGGREDDERTSEWAAGECAEEGARERGSREEQAEELGGREGGSGGRRVERGRGTGVEHVSVDCRRGFGLNAAHSSYWHLEGWTRGSAFDHEGNRTADSLLVGVSVHASENRREGSAVSIAAKPPLAKWQRTARRRTLRDRIRVSACHSVGRTAHALQVM